MSRPVGRGQMPDPPESPPRGPEKRGDSGGCPITPVIIRQLLKATHDPDANAFSLDGKTFAEIRIVARISPGERSPSQNALVYTLDDGTGVIQAKIWPNPEDPSGNQIQALESQLQRPDKPGIYARVHGRLKLHEQQRTVMAFRIEPLRDHNEITHHCLTVIHLHASQGLNPAANAHHPPLSSGGVLGAPVSPPPSGHRSPHGSHATSSNHSHPPSHTAASHPPHPGSSAPALPHQTFTSTQSHTSIYGHSTFSAPKPAPPAAHHLPRGVPVHATHSLPATQANAKPPASTRSPVGRAPPPTAAQSSYPMPASNNVAPPAMTPLEIQVLQAVQRFGLHGLGLSRQQIHAATSGPGVTPALVDAALGSLAQQGALQNTVDDNHFAAAG
eukprot:TRINITY_DN6344_c0_g1_i1.p1 TRINITY_DN6344_c0_g1~~TRINITY_DN6344_c0_g1_i1.p1  ORF type:complete len:387 (-),score=35.27 TRINITY_DN6344_c0_g1_i1:99-1259(-)